MVLIDTYTKLRAGSNLYVPDILRLVPGAFLTTLFTNVLITALITLRILIVTRRVNGATVKTSSDRFYLRFVAITVESGLLYPVQILILTALFYAHDNGLEILSGSNIQSTCPHTVPGHISA